MTDIKTKVQGIDPNLNARAISAITRKTGNIYSAIAVIARRSNQLATELKNELHNKLEEFASVSDTIEEIHENKEQIEISKFYERLPDPTIVALNEYMHDELEFELLDDREQQDEMDEEL